MPNGRYATLVQISGQPWQASLISTTITVKALGIIVNMVFISTTIRGDISTSSTLHCAKPEPNFGSIQALMARKSRTVSEDDRCGESAQSDIQDDCCTKR
jgi:hypothetical protein